MDYLDFGVLHLDSSSRSKMMRTDDNDEEEDEVEEEDVKAYLALPIEGLRGHKFLNSVDQLKREMAREPGS